MRLTPAFALLLTLFALNACQPSENRNFDKDIPLSDTLLIDTIQTAQPAELSILESRGFIKRYIGRIGEQKKINLSLTYWGDGTFSGYYSYVGMGKKIELFGELINDSTFLLKEFVGDDNTGEFRAVLDGETRIAGAWKPAGTANTLPFELNIHPESEHTTSWTGIWFMNGIWDGGTLIIGNETADHFEFALSFTRLGHIGSIEGRAKKRDKKATYEQLEFYDEDEPCKLSFQLYDNYIDLKQESSNIACGFGFRAFAGGKYEKEYKNLKAKLSYGEEDAVFPNRQIHDSFLNLVSQNFYDIFAFNMQGYDKYEKDIKDRFDAQAVAGAVAGLYGLNEAIILFDEQQTFWAATLVYRESDDMPEVHYFTNSKPHQSALPFTIENWKNGFSEYPVVIHYKEKK